MPRSRGSILQQLLLHERVDPRRRCSGVSASSSADTAVSSIGNLTHNKYFFFYHALCTPSQVSQTAHVSKNGLSPIRTERCEIFIFFTDDKQTSSSPAEHKTFASPPPDPFVPSDRCVVPDLTNLRHAISSSIYLRSFRSHCPLTLLGEVSGSLRRAPSSFVESLQGR